MTNWTPPVNLVDNEVSDVDKFNAQVNGNLNHLYYAKTGTFGWTGEHVIQHTVWTSVTWNFATAETVNMWSLAAPERICPPVAGIWLATVRIQWPAGNGLRAVRLQTNGVAAVGQDSIVATPTHTLYTNFTAQIVMDGVGSYFNYHVYQDSGAPVTLDGGHRLDVTWLGAV